MFFRLENVIVGSYDPNDKTCLQGQYFHPDSVGKFVDFLIRFENTGNFAAENVVVKDIIDTSTFDVSSLLITDASHEVYTRIAANKVEFIFENIQLPFEDETNDGYVAFKIKTKSTLILGDESKTWQTFILTTTFRSGQMKPKQRSLFLHQQRIFRQMSPSIRIRSGMC
ncbi:MAG: hypothetical protein IPI53_13685 [Saprospiraceae bacterium]|nr:hypothetical protein [Saprospiraceae bacterium]